MFNDTPRTCFRVFHIGLRRPGPRFDVPPLLEGEDEAAVADDGALGEPLKESLTRHDGDDLAGAVDDLAGVVDDLAVSRTGTGGKKKEMCD